MLVRETSEHLIEQVVPEVRAIVALDPKLIEELVDFADGRRRLIQLMAGDASNNWQSVHTPWVLTREMVNSLEVGDDDVVVWCSLEFLEVLVNEKGFPANRVLYVADSEEDELFAQAVYDCQTVQIRLSDITGVDGVDMSVLSASVEKAIQTLKTA